MQRTKSKLLSILLSLVMLLSLLPTTVLAAGIPDPTAVFVDGDKSFYNNKLYYKSGDPDKSFTGNKDDYIAHYDPTNGTLTLNGYSGGSIKVGGSSGNPDITVVLKGTNTINGNLENSRGGDITITSDSKGTLSITKEASNAEALIGIETGYSGSYETGNVTITGDAKVTISVTNNNSTIDYAKAYGIFAKEDITISEKASVDITCKTPNNTALDATNCNGLRAGRDVIIDTTGEVKIDVTEAGQEAGQNTAQSIGVYPSGNATLTRVGNMEVEWEKHGSHSSYSGGAIYKDYSFDTSTHAVNVDTNNCYASYRYSTSYYTVTVKNGTLTGPGVKYANRSGNFLENDTVKIKPDTKTSESGDPIPFKEWTASGVTLAYPTTADTSFSVPANNVTITATHSPFVGTPTFTRESEANGTIAFKTAVKPNGGTEPFKYVEVGKENDPYGNQSMSSQPTTTSTAPPYVYSVTASKYNTTVIQYLEDGDYRMAVTLNGERYLSDPFTVNYTAPATPTATVADVSIDGTTGTAITDKDVVITLTNDTFESTLSGNWITNLPTGLSQSLSRTDDTHAKITVSGNPSVASSDALAITIPAANLVSNADLTVTSNTNAKYNITDPTNSVNIVAGANMNTTGTANQTGLTGAMTNVVYTADTGYYFPTSYSSIGTSDGVTVTRDSYTQITVSGTPTGNVNITLADATAKTKEATPTATFAAESENGGKLSSVDNTMKYSVDGGGTWVDITGDNMSITNVTTANGVQVKKPATDSNTMLDSDVKTITVTKATAPTGVTAVGCTSSSNNDGKLQNVTTAMEYQKSGATAWTPGTGSDISGLTNGTYYVRVKANGTELASDSQSVVVAAYVAPVEYTISFDGNGGTPSASNMMTVGKKLSSLPTATHSGSYSFVGWYTAASSGTQITTAYVFSSNTTVYAHWTYIGGGGGGGGSYTPSYTVSVDKTENGTITVSPKSASKGDAVTITVTPDKGYELEDLTVLDSKGKELALTEKNGKYTFKMPSGKVTIKASFVEEVPEQIFKDVPANAYYYEAVKWAQEKGITGGIGNGLFGPNDPCTRAQIVTFLWRAAGSPAPKNTGTAFGDVKLGSFYEQAVAWAVENGITGGTGEGMFSPDATCTRAQSVTFLYRASGSPAVSDKAEFSDVSTTAFYADAVAWAAKKGITTGIGGGLFGSGNDCTRGQIVTFLWRCKK